MLITLLLLLIALAAYLLGSVNGAIITSRFIYRRDIRTLGSGNAGLTNFHRIFGTRGLVMVLGIDVVKGVLAALIGGWLLGIACSADVGKVFAAFCLILGHIYPVFYDFKGGKGVLCGISAAFVIDWQSALFCVIVFAVTVFVTRYVSLGSVLGAASFPLALLVMDYTPLGRTLGLFCAIVIIISHSKNIMRLINGTEPKLNVKKDITHKLDDF